MLIQLTFGIRFIISHHENKVITRETRAQEQSHALNGTKCILFARIYTSTVIAIRRCASRYIIGHSEYELIKQDKKRIRMDPVFPVRIWIEVGAKMERTPN